MKFIITTLTILLTYSSIGQTVYRGVVSDEKMEPLIGATLIRLDNQSEGTTTDQNGQFEISASRGTDILVSFVGFLSDTLTLGEETELAVQLTENDSELQTVTIESTSTFIDDLQPIHNEVITSKELLKAACCNLSESFETNASVDVSYSDAVTGTKVIRMLGLDGKYTLINRENMPNVRGLSVRSGLSYIPGPWIQSIDVGKGAGSVVNGYESITGQINVELKKPESGEKLFINSYVNSFGRAELNLNSAIKLSEKWSTALLIHGNYLNNEIDRNNDNFMDLPKSKQINVLNRYKYQGERLVSQIGINIMHEEKAGGEIGFGFGDDSRTSSEYGYTHNSSKAELFGKIGLLFPSAPYKGWGFIYSLAMQKHEMGFGRRLYNGEEKTIYTNLIHQNILGSTTHQYKTGGSLMVDLFDESFADSTFSRNEIVPGAFFEYSFLPSEDITLVLGSRIDFHNLYGIYQSPRVHFRYKLQDQTTLRLAAGKGYRTANIIVENSPAFISSRALVTNEDLRPEEAWNMGGSLVNEFEINKKKLNLTADYFYTLFENQIITDLDANSQEVRFYNLSGRSFAQSLQVEASYKLTPNLSAKTAYKYYNVMANINNELQSLPFISKNRLFLNAGYATKYEKWMADMTLQWFGKQRLPDTSMKSEAFQLDSHSPDFLTLNAQITRNFRWGSIYLGGENILDFRQMNPIIDPENPLGTGTEFDASMSWGPVAGRLIYAGFRYSIK